MKESEKNLAGREGGREGGRRGGASDEVESQRNVTE